MTVIQFEADYCAVSLREALASLEDPRYQNRRYPLWGMVALVPLAFLCRVDSLRGVARFAQDNPSLCKSLGLHKPSGRTAISSELIRRLDPQALASALRQVFPHLPTPTLVADGKLLRGSAKGEQPVVRVVELWVAEAAAPWPRPRSMAGRMLPCWPCWSRWGWRI